MIRAIFIGTLFVIIAFSLVSVAKPAFYLKVLDTPGQIQMEFGPPLRQGTTEKGELIYLYEAGPFRPLCVDYLVTFFNGKLKDWTWRFCEQAPQALKPTE
jgi:hypothetical protein